MDEIIGNEMKGKKIFAVIPAHDEKKYISGVVKKTKQYVDEVIVVDDASSDNTKELAEKEGAIVLRHVINLGLGGTLKTGCEAALLLGADVMITLDGDGQHNPEEIPKLLRKLEKDNLDLVIGERLFNENMPFMMRLGNTFFQSYLKKLFSIKIRDTQSGFRVFTSTAYPKLRWNSPDYGVASEILINAEKNNVNYASEEITTIYNDDYKGTTVFDGLKTANKMFSLKINSRQNTQ